MKKRIQIQLTSMVVWLRVMRFMFFLRLVALEAWAKRIGEKFDRLHPHVQKRIKRKVRLIALRQSCGASLEFTLYLLGILCNDEPAEIVLHRLQKKDPSFHYAWLHRLFKWVGGVPEPIIREYCTNYGGSVVVVREHGDRVPPDILNPYITDAVESGNRPLLLTLTGPLVSKTLLEACMLVAERKGRYEDALKCAHQLRDYQVMARVLSLIGTPEQMLVAQNFLQGRVSHEQLR